MTKRITCHSKYELHQLRSVPYVEGLRLRSLDLENDDLAVLGSMHSLRSLDLEGNESIDDQGLEYIQALTQLKDLNVSDTNVGDDTLYDLTRMPSMRLLLLNHTNVSAKALIECLPYWPNLQRLEVAGTRLSGGFLSTLASYCPQLRGVRLDDTGIKSEDLYILRSLVHLEELSLLGVECTNDTISAWSELKGLKTLRMSLGDDVRLQRLFQFSSLERLGIQDSEVDASIFSMLSKISLQSLELLDCDISDLIWLRHWPTLHTLSLSGSDFDVDEFENVLPGLLNLRNLNVSDTPITNETVQVIGRLPYVQHIDLSHTEVDDDSLLWLENVRSLSSLSASYTNITDYGAEELRLQLGGRVEVDFSEEGKGSDNRGLQFFIFAFFCGVIGWFVGDALLPYWVGRVQAPWYILTGFFSMAFFVLGWLAAQRLL